jgi:ATP-dependent RNA helicase DeaD
MNKDIKSNVNNNESINKNNESNFKNFKLSEQLSNSIKRMGFTDATHIQTESIPLILEGKDIIGESATGSGKTLAFGSGIIEKCEPNKKIQALVLVPTRELAEQVKDEIIKISYGKKLNIIAVYGGVSINPQIDNLKKSEVIIATPGRLLDHINQKTINLSNVKILVLDEADRMIEMGFIEDVEKIINKCPKNRQTLLFSATMYDAAKEIAEKYMINPIRIKATKMVDPKKLKQYYYNVPNKLKKELLLHLLKKESSDLVMVFCNTRIQSDYVVDYLNSNGLKSIAIHGGLNQNKRLKTIDMFHKGKVNILICTDVASRGLHIHDVTHIYNFDLPKEPSDYVHRIGRTARAGKEGLVINILSPRDHDNFSKIVRNYSEFNISQLEKPYLKPSENNQNNQSKTFFKKKNFKRRRR